MDKKDIFDLIEQLETVQANIDNLKRFVHHPFVAIVEMQLNDAIDMANEIAEREEQP